MAEERCGFLCCREARDQVHALDLMLREADHRIANALQTVMAASAADAGPNGAVSASARDQMMMRISAIALVHRMLSVSTSSDAIPIGDYLTSLAESIGALWSPSGDARVSVHHGGGTVAGDVAVRLGMVVNELVTNSFKYAYANRAGDVRVAFSIQDGSFTLIVADDGNGIDDASKRRRGMGSRLVEGIAKQLNASFGYQSARPGTIAILSGSADVLLPLESRICDRSVIAASSTHSGEPSQLQQTAHP
jgi:two-component sensor histidine kinase